MKDDISTLRAAIVSACELMSNAGIAYALHVELYCHCPACGTKDTMFGKCVPRLTGTVELECAKCGWKCSDTVKVGAS